MPQIVPVGGIINFGTPVRRYGCNLDMSNGNVVAKGTGYYNFDTNVSFTAGSSGDAVLTYYKDGVAIPGATVTFGVASGVNYALSVPFMIRQNCCCDAIITAVLTGITATVNTASIVVEKE